MKKLIILAICLLPTLAWTATIYDRPLLPAPSDAARLYIYDPLTHSDRNITWGNLRAWFAPIAPPWESIADKPTVFNPTVHGSSHGSTGTDPLSLSMGQVSGLDAALQNKVASSDPRLSDPRAPLAHTQGIATIDGLQGALDGKQATLGFIPVATTDQRLSDARPPLAHNQDASTVDGLSSVAISGSYNDLGDKPTIPSSATQIAYNHPIYTTVGAALDQYFYVAPSVTALTVNGSSTYQVEIGSQISNPVLAWTVNKTVTSQSFNNSIGAIDPALRNYTHTSTFSTDRTYTITVGDGTNTATRSAYAYFRHKRYWGVSSNASLTDAQIIALSSEFSTSRGQTRNGMVATGQYIYIVYPDSWGAATFTVNGLPSTAWTLVQRTFVNASGNSTLFRIYRSDNLLTGSYNVVVS